MKKILTLRNVLLLGASLFGILVFIFSFLTAHKYVGGATGIIYENKGIIWGAATSVATSGGSAVTSTTESPALGLPLAGALMTAVAGLCLCVLVILPKLFKDAKIKMLVVLACSGLLILGGVFTFFTQSQFEQLYLNDVLTFAGAKDISCALPIISGILAVLAGLAACASQFVKDKKLVK